jgi:hypothetical protein
MRRLHGCMGLTPGSARWLISRVTSHTTAVGLRLGGKRRARPGHVPAPDPYSYRGLPCPGTPPRPGPYSAGPGAYSRDPACPLGSSGPVHIGVRCPLGSGAIDASRDVLSFLATWCSYACPCGGVGRCSPYDLGVSHGCSTFIP